MSDRIEIKLEDAVAGDEIEVIELLVEQGATVAAGDVVIEVATEKANMEIEAPAAGTIELLVAEGDQVPATQVLALVAP